MNMPLSLRALRSKFKFSDVNSIVLRLELEADDFLYVVGDRDNGSYEFVILRGDDVVDFSDCGYGIPNIALREGLSMYYG